MRTGDTPLAECIPCTNFWPGGDGNDYIVVHATASGGVQTAYQLATSDLFNKSNDPTYKGRSASVHYIIGRGPDDDGKIYQCVLENDSAWGNCCTTSPSPFLTAPGKPMDYNWNRCTISIEIVKYSSDNQEAVTAKQYQSLLALVRDIAKRQNIPLIQGTPTQRGIIFHHDLDPKNKARCPGTFPYDTFFNDLKGGSTPMPLVTNNGAVLDLVQSFQLDGGSPDKCGPWATSELKFAGLPGKGPRGDATVVRAWASLEYVKHIGADVISNEAGSSIENMHQFFYDAIEDFGPTPRRHRLLHWFDMDALSPTSKQADDLARVRRALSAGYPVVVTVNEQSVFSLRLGKCPYPWQPAYGPVNHIFTLLGMTSAGDFIVADELNNQEAWPMVYRAATLEMHWASTVQTVGPDPDHPWLAAIPGSDPLTWPANFNAQLFAQGETPMPDPTPAPTPQPTPTPAYQFTDQEKAIWTLVRDDCPLGTGISIAWSQSWRSTTLHRVYGAPTSKEKKIIINGKEYIYQQFAHALCRWDGKAHWENEQGAIA
jgi:hypothetical protein